MPVALLPDGCEQLDYIPGDIAAQSGADWIRGVDTLASVGALLRRLHDTGAHIPVDTRVSWPLDLADPEASSAENAVMCHNDPNMGNVVFREGLAIALIDFDLAAPGRPLWDVAMAARYWAVLADPPSAPTRLRVLADGYGVPTGERAGLPELVEQVTATCRTFAEARVAAGDQAVVKSVAARGGWQRWDRLQTWLETHRQTFIDALCA
ncbi:phosphotransferase [Streptomyces bauhiniae]|uniref:phosphotransferase n=1 Tax=Streptomyces bauhiniae TaxID=2340725 RepID=UPI0037D7CF0C